MTQPRICPECKAEIPVDAPPGVCPYCALRAGLRWEDATRPDRQWGPSTPLTPEELGRRLPELEAFELIGPGGMGTVYKARHRDLDRPVAVKVLHAHLQDDATLSPEQFTDFLAAQPDLSPKAWPRYVWIAEHLPSTATNKVLKRELVAMGADPAGRLLWRRGGQAYVQPDRQE